MALGHRSSGYTMAFFGYKWYKLDLRRLLMDVKFDIPTSLPASMSNALIPAMSPSKRSGFNSESVLVTEMGPPPFSIGFSTRKNV